jgi:hypothetical protein
MIIRMRAPVAADGLVILICCRSRGLAVAAFFGLPISADCDVFSGATILRAGLF